MEEKRDHQSIKRVMAGQFILWWTLKSAIHHDHNLKNVAHFKTLQKDLESNQDSSLKMYRYDSYEKL